VICTDLYFYFTIIKHFANNRTTGAWKESDKAITLLYFLHKGGSIRALFEPFQFHQNQINRVFQEIFNPPEFVEHKKKGKKVKLPNPVYQALHDCFLKCMPATSITERILVAQNINPKGFEHITLQFDGICCRTKYWGKSKNLRKSIKKYYCHKKNTHGPAFKTTASVDYFDMWHHSSKTNGAGEISDINQAKEDEIELHFHPCDCACCDKGYVSYDEWSEEQAALRDSDQHGYDNFCIMIKKKHYTAWEKEVNAFVGSIRQRNERINGRLKDRFEILKRTFGFSDEIIFNHTFKWIQSLDNIWEFHVREQKKYPNPKKIREFVKNVQEFFKGDLEVWKNECWDYILLTDHEEVTEMEQQDIVEPFGSTGNTVGRFLEVRKSQLDSQKKLLEKSKFNCDEYDFSSIIHEENLNYKEPRVIMVERSLENGEIIQQDKDGEPVHEPVQYFTPEQEPHLIVENSFPENVWKKILMK
jgi:hypothetical protein